MIGYKTGPLIGREQLFTTMEVNRNNLPKILERVLPVHFKNRTNIDYLYRYYRGDQPILHRTKKVRPEIKNTIVENHAYEIVEFKTGYTFGQPVQYVQRGKDKDDLEGEMTDTNDVAILNELMFMNDKASQDRELGEWMFITGVGYRMVLPQDDDLSPFKTDVLDPRDTFVVYSKGFGKAPVLAGTMIKLDESTGSNMEYEMGLYSEDMYWRVRCNGGFDTFSIVDERPHVCRSIPIIEYPANPSRLGVFEPVVGLLDALNNSTSNRMDGIEQFVQSFMKFVNCDISENDFRELMDLGAIKVTSKDGQNADVEIITSELNQDQSQTFVDYLYQTVLTITGVPDRRASAGGNTGQALIVGQGWTNAESRAISTELMFKRSESLFLKIVLRILEDNGEYDLDNLKLSDIDVKFTRNKTDNLLVKTQGLQNMLEAGIHPRIAISHSNLFSDPEQVFIDSTEFLEKWKEEKGDEDKNQKPNPLDIY